MASAQVAQGVLLGLGNPLLDIQIKADAAFLKKYRLEANNAIIAEPHHMAMFVEMINEHNPHYVAGGATQTAIRVAQWLFQTPGATTFFGCVGNDDRAAILKEQAEKAGVNVRYCVNNSAPTGTCGAVITGANRSLVAHLGAADFLTDEWIGKPEQWQLVEQAQYFYIGGFVFPVCPDAIIKIAKHACENNKVLAINFSAPFLCKHFADKQHNIMQYIDVLFGNKVEVVEFCKLQGIKSKDIKDMALQIAMLPKLNKSRERIVVFTQSKDPTILAKSGKVFSYPTQVVTSKESIVDTTGCGDAFAGGFLVQFVKGKELDECVRCGHYAAHHVIQQWGCTLEEKPNFV